MRTLPLAIKLGVLAALAAVGLLVGITHLGPAPQSAEASFLTEVKKLLASDAQAFDYFGLSVAISGDTAVVGAHGEGAGGSEAGAAYILHRNQGGANNWGEVKKLTASDAAAGGKFGYSVAVSGDIVVAGASEESAGGADAGAAYVFQRDQGGPDNWGEVKKLTASDAQAGDEFGYSVAVSGDTVIAGALLEDAGGSDAGAAYVFQRNQGGADNWGEVMKLIASDAQAGDFLGIRVSVSANTAIVGALFEDTGGDDAGAAYVFNRDEGGPGNWGEMKKLTASDAEAEDRFGNSVAISGDTAIVGADSEAAGGDSAGAGYVFQRDQGGLDNWGEVTKLTAADAEAGDHFGRSVAIDDDTAVVGAYFHPAGPVGLAGAAYVFRRNQGGPDTWGEVMTLSASDPQLQDLFGVSVSLSGDSAIAGAHFEDDGGKVAGAAYVFDLLVSKPTATPTPTLTPCAPEGCPTATPTPAPPAMSLRVDASQQTYCQGGPQEGKVCVGLDQKFDVIVVADVIPQPGGYFLAQAWIDYDNQGLVHKKNTQALWDCDIATFLPSQDVANNGAAAGCLRGVFSSAGPSLHVGDLYSFSLTCTDTPNSSDIQLLPAGDPIAGTSGTVFLEWPTFVQIVPDVSGITVNCEPPPTKLPHPGDTDGDGCSDLQENGLDETLGGQRDWLNEWDFYDVLGPGAALPTDGVIDLPNDILGVIQHFSPSGAAPYDVQFDRGPSPGPNPWNMTVPDGVIDLPNDILGVIKQFNHNCQ